MNKKKQTIFPKHQLTLEQMGENIKLARKRRKLTAIQLEERADIDRTTLYQMEKGNPSTTEELVVNLYWKVVVNLTNFSI